jgi:hypothetical protein
LEFIQINITINDYINIYYSKQRKYLERVCETCHLKALRLNRIDQAPFSTAWFIMRHFYLVLLLQ